MKKWLSVISFILTLSPISVCVAGNVDTYGIGSKATALGGAFSAYADDPYAVYYNPAGLTQVKDRIISAGVHMIDPSIDVDNFSVSGTDDPDIKGPKSFSDTSSNLFAPHLGYAMPVNDKLGLGVAVYAPWGLELEWDENPATNPGAYNTFHCRHSRVVASPTLAYEVRDNLSVGFGLSLGRSEAEVEKRLYLSPELSSPDHNARVKIDVSDDFNYSFNFGVMYRPVDSMTLGLTYRSRTDTKFEGDLKFNGVKVSDVTCEIDHPEQIQLGIRYLPLPYEKLSLELDFVWTNWSIIENQSVYMKQPFEIEPVPGGGTEISEMSYRRDWKDTRQIRIGIEWQANDWLTLRGGYFYDPSPIPDTTWDIMWADADKKTYSLGLGLNFGRWSVDTVVQYTDIEMPRSLGGESSSMNQEFSALGDQKKVTLKADGVLWGAGLTLNYNF